MLRLTLVLVSILFSTSGITKGTNVYGLGIYDVKFDGSEKNQATDFRYEYRSDESLLNIGPKEDNFFYIKPLFGIEYTSDSAYYFLTGFISFSPQNSIGSKSK